MNSNLDQIQVFSKVAQLQSFTRAAEALGIEKSTVSTKVSQLESRLGIRLLQRTTRSVSLSDAGAQYLAYCEQALAALQMGEDYIAGLSDIPQGPLRISAPQNLVDALMPSVIIPFLEQYPKVSLEIVQASQKADLIKEKIDIAVVSSSDDIRDSSLIYRKMYHSDWIVAASTKHIERFGVPQNPQELTSQPSVGTIYQAGDALNTRSVYWLDQKVVLKHRFAVNNVNSVRLAVEAGLGFGLLPKNMILKQLDQGQLVEISSGIKIRSTSLYVVYPSRSGQPAKSKAFVDELLQWGRLLEA